MSDVDKYFKDVDAYFNLGIILKGSLRALDDLKCEIAKNPDISIIYQKTTPYRLRVMEVVFPKDREKIEKGENLDE